MKTVIEAYAALAPKHSPKPDIQQRDYDSFEDFSLHQSIRGIFSGIQRRCASLRNANEVGFQFPDNRDGRRRIARARRHLLWCIGMVAEAERDDGNEKQCMIWNNEHWMLSMLVFVGRFARKSVTVNKFVYLGKLPDYEAIGAKAAGLRGDESLEEILAAAKKFIWRGNDPQTTSKETLSVSDDVAGEEEVMPVKTSKKPEYQLTADEYAALKAIVPAERLKSVAGRLGSMKKRGDVAGFLNTLYLVAEKKHVPMGRQKCKTRKKSSKAGEAVSKAVASCLVGAVSAWEMAYRVAHIISSGELPS